MVRLFSSAILQAVASRQMSTCRRSAMKKAKELDKIIAESSIEVEEEVPDEVPAEEPVAENPQA